MTSTLLRHVRVVGSEPQLPGPAPLVDIAVESGRITAITPAADRSDQPVNAVDMHGAFVIPGMVNAHAHNHEIYLKGTGWGLPLEPYILANSPVAPTGAGLEDDALYDRTLLVAREMLRNGYTAVADDMIHPRMERSAIDAVLHAYADSGIRAWMSLMVEDSPWRRSIPLAGQPDHYDRLLDTAPHNPEAALALYRELIGSWHHERVRLMVSPSAPQRCTPRFLHRLVDLSRDSGLPFHVHVQETLAQRSQGRDLFAGRTMIRFLAEEGLLGTETMIAHAIWLDDEEIELVGAAGSTVVHNPVSNAKLGSGIAPVRELLHAGVPVALGTDGLTCNDSLDPFEVMKSASLMSNLASTDPAAWLTPSEVLRAAFGGGSPALGLTGRGSLEVGAVADLVFLDPDSFAFIPANDSAAQTVFSARSRDVRDVMVDGSFLVTDAELVTAAPGLAERVAEAASRFWHEARGSLAANARLMPYVNQAYSDAVKRAHRPDFGPYRLLPSFGGARHP